MAIDELSTLWSSLFDDPDRRTRANPESGEGYDAQESLENETGGDDDMKKLLDMEIDNSGFKNLTKKTLVLKGAALTTIFRSKTLLRQLRSVMRFSHSVIGFEMQPSHKALVVRLLKEQGQTVMAVGDGFNDIGMIKEADIGVQVTNSNVPVVFSDMVIPTVGTLDTLIFKNGQQIFRAQMENVLIYIWLSLSLLSLPYTTYFQSSAYSGYFYLPNRLAMVLFGLLLVFSGAVQPIVGSGLHTRFPVLYRQHEILQTHFSSVAIGVIFLAIVEMLMIMVMLGFFMQSKPQATAFLPGIQQYHIGLSFVAIANGALKVWFWRSDRHMYLMVWLIGIVSSCALFQFYLWQNLDLVDRFDLLAVFKDPVVLFALFSCISVTSLLNFCGIGLVKRVVLCSGAVHAIEIYQQISKRIRDLKQTKVISDERLTGFITSKLNQFMDLRRDKKFRVTLILQSLLKLNRSSPSSVITKILSVDLFNFQFGMKRFTNYIIERVERRSFREYLQMISLKHARAQFKFYMVLLMVALVVGASTPEFRYNFMLDSTKVYAMIGLGAVYITLHYERFAPYQYTTLLCFGGASLVYTVLMSMFSYNRFDWNLTDMYSVRIWFNVLFDLVETSILGTLHIVVKVVTTLNRFSQSSLYVEQGILDYSQSLLFLILYYGFLIILKAKVRGESPSETS